MWGPGLVWARIRKAKPQTRCQRCGLSHDRSLDHCPHCGDLDERQLLALRERIETQREAGRNLGGLFLIIALALGLFSLLLLL